MFEIVENNGNGTIIKVVGVGGAGGNAVDHMIKNGVQGVEFVAANTDAQALMRGQARNQIQLGATGLGAGAKPEAGRAAAEEAREQIAESLQGAHMASRSQLTNPLSAVRSCRRMQRYIMRSYLAKWR